MRRMSNTNYSNFTFHYQAIGHLSVFFTKQYAFSIADLGGRGRAGVVFPIMAFLYREAPPIKGYLFQDLRNMRVGKYVISMICKTTY